MSNYDSPKHSVIINEGNYQIRDYQPALAVSTKSKSSNKSFRKIFKFISGENSKDKEISMTVPVRMEESLAEKEMAFFMPHKFDKSTLPLPKDSSLSVKEFPGGKYAVVSFSGGTGQKKVKRKLRELVTWVGENGYQPTEIWHLDRYDPPWTLSFFRTNEIVLKLKEK